LKRALFFLGLLFILPLISLAQDEDRMEMIARVQSRFSANLPADSSFSELQNSAQIRRARLGVRGSLLEKKFSYQLLAAFDSPQFGDAIGNQFGLLDAFVIWKPREFFEVKFGQFLLPGNAERSFTSKSQQFVEQSMLSSRFGLDRDIGIELMHKWQLGDVGIRERVFAGNGEGQNQFGNFGGLQYVGRLEILPFGFFSNEGDNFMSDLSRESTPKLLLGASWSYNDNTRNQIQWVGEELAIPIERDVLTWNIDLHLKWKGFSWYTQYAQRSVELPFVYDETLNLRGFYDQGDAFTTQLGILFGKDFELAGRYTMLSNSLNSVSLLSSDLNEYTLGFSKYLKNHDLKLQTDFMYSDFGSPEVADNIGFRVQLELGI